MLPGRIPLRGVRRSALTRGGQQRGHTAFNDMRQFELASTEPLGGGDPRGNEQWRGRGPFLRQRAAAEGEGGRIAENKAEGGEGGRPQKGGGNRDSGRRPSNGMDEQPPFWRQIPTDTRGIEGREEDRRENRKTVTRGRGQSSEIRGSQRLATKMGDYGGQQRHTKRVMAAVEH